MSINVRIHGIDVSANDRLWGSLSKLFCDVLPPRGRLREDFYDWDLALDLPPLPRLSMTAHACLRRKASAGDTLS